MQGIESSNSKFESKPAAIHTIAIHKIIVTVVTFFSLSTPYSINAEGQPVVQQKASTARPGPDDQTRDIIEGTRVDPRDWPFIVQTWSDADGDGLGSQCEGSLIHPNWVLTAAHCLEEDGTTANDARVLIPALNLPPSGGNSYVPEWRRAGGRVILHPEYDPDGETSFPDLGLIELVDPIPASRRTPLRVLSPLEESRYAPIGTTVTQIGYAGPEDEDARYDLYWIDVILDDFNGCTDGAYRSLSFAKSLDRWARCAGPPNVSESGDSGGPLVVRLPDGSWGQVGVTSTIWRTGESDDTKFTGFTRVSAVYDWIAQYVTLQVPLVRTSSLNFPLFVTGLSWTTEFVIANPFEDYSASVELQFFDGPGNGVDPLPPHQSTFTIPAGGTYTVELPGSGSILNSGSAVAIADSRITGFVRFRAGDRAWLGANGVAAMDGLDTVRMALSARIGIVKTYVSVRNPNPDNWINVHVSLVSVGGDVLRTKSDIYIAPNGRYLKGLHTLFPEYLTASQQFEGTVIVEGMNDALISVGAFDIGSADGEFSGIPGMSDDKKSWILIADRLGRDTTLGQLLQLLGFAN